MEQLGAFSQLVEGRYYSVSFCMLNDYSTTDIIIPASSYDSLTTPYVFAFPVIFQQSNWKGFKLLQNGKLEKSMNTFILFWMIIAALLLSLVSLNPDIIEDPC